MSSLSKRVELLANIAIIIVAILLGVVVVNRYLLPASLKSKSAEAAQVKPGVKISLPGVDWEKGGKTLLLVLSTTCHYCTESAPFYQQLVRRKDGRGDMRIMAVLPQNPGEAQKYLGDHGITVDEVRQAVPGALYATATPTLVIVDGSGSVVESWVGKLPPEKEAEVLNRFFGQASGNQ